MKLTFVDSGVLIAAARGNSQTALAALEILDDHNRNFASSVFVRLETIQKAAYQHRDVERELYEEFFKKVAKWATGDDELIQLAFDEALAVGLSAMDSLHIAAALKTGCDELVTTEAKEKALHRTSRIRVATIKR